MSLSLSQDEIIQQVRKERYLLQSVARKALTNQRIATCLRIPNMSDVEVWKHLTTDKAFYKGLLVCGSVWHCPVCSAKISERRREELKIAFKKHKENGGYIAMLTLTFSHKFNDSLEDLLKKFGQATVRLFSGKRYNKIRLELGLIGRIRVFEITYGSNGFHPHAHIALFYKNNVDLQLIEKKMYELWEMSCLKNGLETSRKYGLDLENGEKAEEYLSKGGNWSLDQEMTKAHIKKGKEGGLTPFDLLRKYLDTEDEIYLFIFRKYAFAMKGKRHLQWSQGLKKMFLIEDKKDEVIAEESKEEADLLGMLTYEEWKAIVNKDHDYRASFLNSVEKHGFEESKKMYIKKRHSKESIL